jgi:tetratricopeptide (TPR) repeat protein
MYGHPMADQDAFRYDLMKKGVTHVLVQPVDLLSFSTYGGSSMDSNHRWARTQEWLASARPPISRFIGILKNTHTLYEVTADSRFMSAYEAYRASFNSMEAGLPIEARSHLKEALRLDPNIPSVLNAYGVSQLMAGQYADAETCFQRALQLRPDYPLALVNAARAQAQQGKKQPARRLYERAGEVIARTGEGTRLVPSIQKELRSL